MSAGEEPRRSSVAFELPDVCVWTLVGDVDVDLMRDLADTQERDAKGLPYFFSMLDVTDVGTVSPEARKEAARKRAINHVLGTAFVGASFHIRVVATLVTKASTVLNPQEIAPIRFFKTKAEAFAWFEEIRRERVKGAGVP